MSWIEDEVTMSWIEDEVTTAEEQEAAPQTVRGSSSRRRRHRAQQTVSVIMVRTVDKVSHTIAHDRCHHV